LLANLPRWSTMSRIVSFPARPPGVRIPAALALCALIYAASALPAHAQPTFEKRFTPDTIGIGSTSALTFTITTSSDVALDLAFNDVLPAGLEFASPASPTLGGNCNEATFITDGNGDPTLDGDTTLQFFSDRLGAGQTCTVRVDVTGASAGIYTNTSGDLTSSAGNSGPASDDLTLSSSAPEFSKTFFPDSVAPGETTRLVFSLENPGSSNVFNMSFTDPLPTGLEVAFVPDITNTCPAGTFNPTPGATTMSLFGGFLTPETSCELGVDVLVTAAGAFDNRTTNLNSSAGSSGFAVDRITAAADPVGLTKHFDDPVPPGGTTDLAFTISNNTRETVTGIAFTDDLDATLSGLQATGTLPATPCGAGSSISGTGTLTFSGGTLDSGESCAFTVAVTVPAGATPGTYPNTTSTVATSAGSFAPASDDLDVGYAPALTKAFCQQVASTADPCVAVEQVTGGEVLTARFTVTNPDPDNAVSALAFSDDFAAMLGGTTVDPDIQNDVCGAGSAFFDTDGSAGGETYSLADGSLAADSACTFQVDVQLPATIPPGTYVYETTPVIGDFGAGPVIGNTAQDQLTRSVAPELTKNFLDPVGAGDTVDLAFTLDAGESTLPFSDIAFSDDLDATLSGLDVFSAPPSPCGGTLATGGGSNLSLTGASLAVGETCAFAVTLQVPAAATPGSYPSSTSDVAATADGQSVVGNPATDELDIAFVDFAKRFTDDPTVAGGSVTLSFQIDNMGTEPMTALTFTDDLDAMLAGLSPADTPQSDICGTGSSLTFGSGVLTLTDGNLASGETCEFSTVLQVPAAANPGEYPNVTSALSGNAGGNPFSVPGASDAMELEIEDLIFFDAFEDN
jgi:uncharacterized repeat protein (TIGR01451 family)